MQNYSYFGSHLSTVPIKYFCTTNLRVGADFAITEFSYLIFLQALLME